ncbi:MAG: PQQ-like beta-propeller repeat protein [Pirellulaceae bacterium]|nr:PQQ-like beta-propeller repeat protein [Pirellulaceae bacterium]
MGTIKTLPVVSVIPLALCGFVGILLVFPQQGITPPSGNPLSVTVVGKQDSSGDWPHWLGPKYDGISEDQLWSPETFKKGPKELWKASVGIGYSSFAISDGKLYTMGHDGKKPKGKETVYCVDTETGKTVWQFDYESLLVDNTHSGGPGATPAVDEKNVYALSREGMLYCLDKVTGKEVWSKQLATLVGVALPPWGFTCSPLLLEDKVILDVGCTIALNKESGKEIWRSEKFHPGYGAARPLTIAGEEMVAVLNNDFVMIFNAKTGKEFARSKWKTNFDCSASTPVVIDDTIFISTGYNEGCVLLKITDKGLEPIYENRKMRNHFNNTVYWEGNLYGIDGNTHSRRRGKIVCMDYKTGEEKWNKVGYGVGSVLVSRGYLIILSDEGDLILAKASAEKYDELAKHRVLNGLCWTVPVLTGGRLYCRDATGNLVCLDLTESS